MLSLPSKPWKKVKIEALEQYRYRIVFLTDVPTEAAMAEVIEKDIRPCLGPQDELDAADWASRSVTLTTSDLGTFRRHLVFACVMVVTE